MKIIRTIAEMRFWQQACHEKSATISFVPTMGNLHDGHLQLVDDAKKIAKKVVVSIFVNPTQFAANEDLDKYPRTEQQDLKALEQKKIDVVFIPTLDEIYPDSEDINYVDVPAIAQELEGKARPTHFRGVATVVNKLFDIVQPDHAIFGEKDFQQLLIIKNMVQELGLKIIIHSAPIVRAADGVALSSRNQYLNPKHRKLAPILYKSLQDARSKLLKGEIDNNTLEMQSIDFINKNGFDVDYFVIRDATTLAQPGLTNRVILLAARLGDTRLLDNIRVD